MSCGVGRRHGSDPELLWLWRRPAGTAPIRPLAWEPSYAAGAAQEIAKKDKKRMPSVGKRKQLFLDQPLNLLYHPTNMSVFNLYFFCFENF